MKRKARVLAAVAALLFGMLVAGMATMPQAEAHGFVRFGFGFPGYGPRFFAPPPPPPVVYEPPPPPVVVERRVALYRPPPPIVVERRVAYYAPPPRLAYYTAPLAYHYRHHTVRHVRHAAYRQCSCQCCR